MPVVGTNYAVNPNFNYGPDPTDGWSKYPVSAGYKPGNRLHNWCNALGTSSDGSGGRELVSTTTDTPTGTAPVHAPATEAITIPDESTPAASHLCGVNYLHNGSGFLYKAGEVYRIRMTVKRTSVNDPDLDAIRPSFDLIDGHHNTRVRPRLFVTSPSLSYAAYYDLEQVDGGSVLAYEAISDLTAAGASDTFDFEFKIPYWLYGADGFDTNIEYVDPTLNPDGEQLHIQLGWQEDEAPNLYDGWGVTFAVLPGWELTFLRQDTVPPVYPGGPIGPPGTIGPLSLPTDTPPQGPTMPGFTLPAAPVPTWSGCPIVTFPYGCEDPTYIHLEFDVPTWDRDPWHIPNVQGDLGEVYGNCENSVYNFISPGVVPASGSSQWVGAGAEYDLYIDGVLHASLGALVSGGHFDGDVSRGPAIDLTASHSYTIHARFQDVPGWIFDEYEAWRLHIACVPPMAAGPLGLYYDWATRRAALPTGFDPGYGEDWGPFGADVPRIGVENNQMYIWAGTDVPETQPGVTYEFDGPACAYQCTFAGFYDPAAGATPADNAPPGTGGDPTSTGTVVVSTGWGCRDGRSFQVISGDVGSAVAPYDTVVGAAQPSYIELAPAGGDYDTWYYQSALLNLPIGFAASLGNGGNETWTVMGMRTFPNTGPPSWRDPVLGLALIETSGSFAIQSFLGNVDVLDLGSPTPLGTPFPISEGVHCLSLAVRSESDRSGTRDYFFGKFQVDSQPEQTYETRATYYQPYAALWGLLDNANHTYGSQHSVYYIDDLRFDTQPVGCRCAPGLGLHVSALI